MAAERQGWGYGNSVSSFSNDPLSNGIKKSLDRVFFRPIDWNKNVIGKMFKSLF